MKKNILKLLKNDIVFCLTYGAFTVLLQLAFEGMDAFNNPRTYLDPIVFSTLYLGFCYYKLNKDKDSNS